VRDVKGVGQISKEAGYPDRKANHGYLAVDFFFLLSGFVIAYAYDDRWSRMTQWEFYKRRLIRLQPMVIMGSLIGAALFYFQKGSTFPLVASTPVWKMLLVMLVGCTLLPLPTSMDIRGWDEMHPLDGPAWSLFFEYIGNILYAVGFRKLSNRVLGVFVLLAAAFLVHLAVFGPRGDMIGGWALDAKQLHIGFARLLFPFFAGILLMRLGKRIHIKGAFGICSFLLIVALSLPRFGGTQHHWMNGLYEALCIIVLFPIIVAIGAGEKRADDDLFDRVATGVCLKGVESDDHERGHAAEAVQKDIMALRRRDGSC
jgi:peptidoglycan/LPS O-acetylase OafA/YrhL